MMSPVQTSDQDASSIAEAIRLGKASARSVVEEAIGRICLFEDKVQAFAHHEGTLMRSQTNRIDRGEIAGPLAGVPIGIKDVFDTFDLPTEFNSPIYAGNQPAYDACVVDVLRRAGAGSSRKATRPTRRLRSCAKTIATKCKAIISAGRSRRGKSWISSIPRRWPSPRGFRGQPGSARPRSRRRVAFPATARNPHRGRADISITLPGLRISFGSNARLTTPIACSLVSSAVATSEWMRFDPTPCSAENEPPRPTRSR